MPSPKKLWNDANVIGKLKEAFGDLYNDLELVEANLFDSASLAEAVAGSHTVLNALIPITQQPVIKTIFATLKACSIARVKNCVITQRAS